MHKHLTHIITDITSSHTPVVTRLSVTTHITVTNHITVTKYITLTTQVATHYIKVFTYLTSQRLTVIIHITTE